MRLSEATMLGMTEYAKEFNPSSWYGCLLGIGLRAMAQYGSTNLAEMSARFPWLNQLFKVPEWLVATEDKPSTGENLYYRAEVNKGHLNGIKLVSWMAFKLRDQQITLEQVVDWVRSVEPAEPTADEPEETPIVAEAEAKVSA